MPHLETIRLTLLPLTADLAWTAVTDRGRLAGLLGVTVPDEWPGPDLSEVLPLIATDLEQRPELAEWSALMVHREDRMLIGMASFKDMPDPSGTVELGYGTNASYRRQGYTYEATSALLHWAFDQPGVRRVVAECEEENAGSRRTLEKLGMRLVGKRGTILQWEITRTAGQQ